MELDTARVTLNSLAEQAQVRQLVRYPHEPWQSGSSNTRVAAVPLLKNGTPVARSVQYACYFGAVVDGQAPCALCGSKLTWGSNVGVSIVTHLARNHPDVPLTPADYAYARSQNCYATNNSKWGSVFAGSTSAAFAGS